MRRPLRQGVGEFPRGRFQLVQRHDAVHQPPAFRLVRGKLRAEQGPFQRLADAHELLQQARAGRDAALDERHAQRGGVRHDAQVAAERQVEAGAVRVPVHHADDRLGERPQLRHDERPAAFALRIVLHRVGERALRRAGLGHALEVVPGTERAPGAGQHDDANRLVVVAVLQRVEEFQPDADVDRVQPLGPVQGEAAHAAVTFDQQVTEIHAHSPESPAKTGTFSFP